MSTMALAVAAGLLLLVTELVHCDQWPFPDGEEYTLAHINVSYVDPTAVHNEAAEMGKFGNSRIGSTAGIVVHVRSANSSSHYGCDMLYENEIPVMNYLFVYILAFIVLNLTLLFSVKNDNNNTKIQGGAVDRSRTPWSLQF